MFESLFGAEMPLAVRFFLAFLIVLALIGATAWAVRRFGSGRLGNANLRGRQPRLAVIDYASVDARRRLILVRRDNVEHLLMIGGPTDVVVEPNIVRASAAPRDVGAARPPSGVESLPRTIPLPDSSGSWPLQPEPAGIPRPPRDVEEPAAWPVQPHAETAPRPPRDTLAALADELTVRPTPQAPLRGRTPAGQRVLNAEPRLEQRPEPRTELRPEPRAELRSEPRAEQRSEARAELRPEPRPEPRPQATQPAADGDQSLAEMAHRLEAALRKPNAAAEGRDPRANRPPPVVVARQAPPEEDEQPDDLAAPLPPPPRAARPADPKLPRSDAKSGQGKALYDSLEQEMASLLGRPTNKT